MNGAGPKDGSRDVARPHAPSLLGAVVLGAILLTGRPVAAQEPPSVDEMERVRTVHRAVSAVDSALGDGLWPDFRPAETPVLYTGLSAAVLVNWPGELPEGFRPVEGTGGAAWSRRPRFGALVSRGTTFTSLDSSYSLPGAVALAVHEHFHTHQRRAAREGAGFGLAETPADVRLYPAFDTLNAARLGLEGRLLAAARRAQGEGSVTRARVREFLAVRERRHAALEDRIARWERRAEMNEGLADYVALRALRWLAEEDHRGWAPRARAEIGARLDRLEDLIRLAGEQLRRRQYATGSVQGLLLDGLMPDWRGRVVTEDVTLADLLPEAVGYRPASAGELHRRAARREDLPALRAEAGAFLAALSRRRRSRADSVLQRPGLRITLAASEAVHVCGLDPLNVRHVDHARVLHPAFLRLCSDGEQLSASFRGPTVEDVESGRFSIVAGDSGEVRVASDDGRVAPRGGEGEGTVVRGLSLRSPAVTIDAARARVRRSASSLWIQLLP